MGVCVDCGVLFSTLLTGRIFHCGECDGEGVRHSTPSGTCKCNCARVMEMLKAVEGSISELRASDKVKFDKMEKDIATMKTSHDSDKKDMEEKVANAQEKVEKLSKELKELRNSFGISEPDLEVPIPSKKIPRGNPNIF